ncbi:MAG: aldo/keto reductase [bacterium]|nr:aldo/keto reductase [bacterium]
MNHSGPKPCGPDTPLGLGCWAIGGHGWGQVDDESSIEAISFALDNGVQLFDTADCYGFGHSELILGKALGTNRHKVVVSTKGGIRWDENGKIQKDNSPTYLRTALQASLQRLKLDSAPLYFVHWPDGKTPIAEVMIELEKMRQEGLLQTIGVSNFSPEQLAEAGSYGKVDVLQVKVNLLEREKYLALANVCARDQIKVMAFGCLAEGMLTGKVKSDTQYPPTDHRSRNAFFQGDTLRKNLKFVAGLEVVAQQAQSSVANVALKSVLDHDGINCALFGARTALQVQQNLASLTVKLHPVQEKINNLVHSHNLPPLVWKP